jgi:putative transposase
MLISLTTLLATLSSIFHSRVALELENLALRHQIDVLQRSARKRPKLTPVDRLLWVWLSRIWSDWRWALAIVEPETVVAWHRKGFGLFWTWKVRCGQPGRPVIFREVRDLIRKMCRENPSWGAPRIHGELRKLGIAIGESSVSKYMVRCRKPPSQTWRTFLENHAKEMVAIDFFTVPTIRFQVLYVFLVLAHDRRRILHFNVTAHPTAEWTGQQPSASGSAVGCIAVTCAGQSNFDLDGCQANRKSEVIRSRMVPTNVLVFTNIAGVPSS